MGWLTALATEYKDLTIVVSWLLTCAGWYYNSKSAADREVRKEARKEVDECIKAAYDLLQQTKAYYYDADRGKDADRTSRIRFDLHRLLKRLERLSSRFKNLDSNLQSGELMDCLTGDDFDQLLRSVLVPRDERVRAMESSVHALIDRLEDGFYTHFKD